MNVIPMNVSLDGYVEDASSLDWALVDEEIHQFSNDQEQSFDVTLYGQHGPCIPTGPPPNRA